MRPSETYCKLEATPLAKYQPPPLTVENPLITETLDANCCARVRWRAFKSNDFVHKTNAPVYPEKEGRVRSFVSLVCEGADSLG
jgi:hypothetical protein